MYTPEVTSLLTTENTFIHGSVRFVSLRFVFIFIVMCVSLNHNAHKLLHIPVIQSGGSAVQTERKLDDDQEPGGC